MATYAPLSTADEALYPTDENANFLRLARLLMRGGHTLLKEVFDSFHPPAQLSTMLQEPATYTELEKLKKKKVITQLEWDRLHQPDVKSADFDISLLFKMLRNFCPCIIPPASGWDILPSTTDHSLEADLARIKYYRNTVYGHNVMMEITDADFHQLWSEISEAFLRIAGSRLTSANKDEWKKAIDKFRHDPLTQDAEQDVEELRSWCKKDMDTKDEVEKLNIKQEQMNIKQEQMGNKQEQMNIMQKQMNIMQEQMNIIQEQVNNKLDIVIKILTSVSSSSKSIESPISPAAGQLLPNIPQVQDVMQSESVSIQASGPTQPPSYRELQQNPSTDRHFWHLVYSFKESREKLIEYLRKLEVDVLSNRLGSLVITVSCSSLEVLEGLWQDYCSGHLNDVVQETLVTAEVLKELNLNEVKLKTIISEEEYKACKELLIQRSDIVEVEETKLSTRETPSITTSRSADSDENESVKIQEAASEETDSNPPEHTVTLIEKERLPKKREPLDHRQLPIDILLMTVKDCEFLCCLSYLNQNFRKTFHPRLGDVYLGNMGKAEPKLKIAVMKSDMGPGGRGGSTVTVIHAVRILRPKAVFYVGFCGGLNPKKVNLGDVVISEKLITYAPSKVKENVIKDRSDEVRLNPKFLKIIRNVYEGWKAPLKDPKERKVETHRGAFLSSPLVIDNSEWRESLIKRFPEAIAIEMEDEGLYAAGDELRIGWIVIKGVSDFADGRKSVTDSWRKFASLMAASLTAHILSDPILFQGMHHYTERQVPSTSLPVVPHGGGNSSAGVLHGEDQPSDYVLDKLSRLIPKGWGNLGRELKVPEHKIVDISVSQVLYHTEPEKAFQVLKAWKNRGESVTYAELYRALKEVDLKNLVGQVKSFRKNESS